MLLDELTVSTSIRDQTDFSFISHISRRTVELKGDLERIRTANLSLIEMIIPPTLKEIAVRDSHRQSDIKDNNGQIKRKSASRKKG